MNRYSVAVWEPRNVLVEAESPQDAVKRAYEGEGEMDQEFAGAWEYRFPVYVVDMGNLDADAVEVSEGEVAL